MRAPTRVIEGPEKGSPQIFRNIRIILHRYFCLKDRCEVVLLSLRVAIGLVTANNVFSGSGIQ